jgi:ribosomal protein S12 methylthiotransferase accessory factor
LADITRLDTLGVPVWQAIRPWSRSITVHQGKGFTPDAARIAAAMEAVECACAEAWRPREFMTFAPDAVPEALRPPTLAGFARVAPTPADRAAPIAWTPAARLDGKGEMLVPVAVVSLDLTRPAPGWLVRSSNGQGAGDTRERAVLKGVCELVERDAFARWTVRSPVERMRSEIALDTIGASWLDALRSTLAAQGVRLRAYALDAAVEMPVIAAELLDGRSQLRSRAFAAGTCAHPLADEALAGAVIEAAQARLGQIAGSRDDIDLLAASELPNFLGFAIPRPGSVPALDFDAARRRWDDCARWTSSDLAVAPDEAGYPSAAVIDLEPPLPGVHVVRVVAPGLVRGREALRGEL